MHVCKELFNYRHRRSRLQAVVPQFLPTGAANVRLMRLNYVTEQRLSKLGVALANGFS
jgi:hypothetical protein